jgi:acetyl esterase/lipase
MTDYKGFEWIMGPENPPVVTKEEFRQNLLKWKVDRDKEWNEFYAGKKPLDLWENGAPGFNAEYGQKQPSLLVYPEKPAGEKRGSVIISAGGGFTYKSIWEAEPVAVRFFEAGFTTFILDYRVLPYERKYSELDCLRAVKFVRYNADRFNVKKDKIAVLGFSAGAYISAATSVNFDYGIENSSDLVERESSRPDVVVMCYGSLTSEAEEVNPLARPFSNYVQKEKAQGSLLYKLRTDSPPFFLWQTKADDARRACRAGMAFTERGIPFEMHIFPEGNHGCGLADGKHPGSPYSRSTVRWSQMAIEFLENSGF